MHSLEIAFLKALEATRNDFLNSIFEFITILGEETILVILICIIYFAFSKELAKKITFITLTSLCVNSTIKNIAKVPRPFSEGEISCLRPDTATGYSFPSGHTQNVAAWSSSFAFLLKKHLMLVISILITLLVAFSRMYLGAHYPSDVIAGGVLGILISSVCAAVHNKAGNKNILSALIPAVMTPFAIYFYINPDALYEDFYKIYGMLLGYLSAVCFEERYVQYKCTGNTLRRTLRVIIAILVAYFTKEYTGYIIFENISILFIWEMLRYYILIFAIFAICPLLYKFIKL